MKQPACVIAGETHIGQLAALYARARVVLGPDSGPLHLAAAVSTPTVTLYGPADPLEFGPWGPREKHIILASDIGCRPCRILDWADDNPDYHPCMRDITIGQVLDAARRVANEQ
jgi:ADP-heptose:LPS heptosyltransferase